MFLLFFLFRLADCYAGWGTWATPDVVRTDYKFRLTTLGDPASALQGLDTYWAAYYQIDLKIEPCSSMELTGGLGNQCCSNTGEVNCQDISTDAGLGIVAGPDLQFAYLQNAHISTCQGTDAADDPNCGTYIEIHRSDNGTVTDSVAEVLASVQLFNSNGAYQTAYISTGNLCAGNYALWWVVRTRSGPYVQFQKNFQVIYPSCSS